VTEKITFTLDGSTVEASPDETIWQVASRQGTRIPHLCYAPEPGYRPDGNCRACMVEIEGERVLAASCMRKPAQDMVVRTATEQAGIARRMVMEMLVADQPSRETAHDPQSKFWAWADEMGISESRFPAREKVDGDSSHVAMAVNLDACIHCNLCVRACREVQVNDVIGMAYRGAGSKIVFDFDDPMGKSTCVACGECVQACPTGALMEVPCARIAVSVARRPCTSRKTEFYSLTGATAPRTNSACASRVASVSITSITRTGSPRR
jgi:formate dehydrogenase major subunit